MPNHLFSKHSVTNSSLINKQKPNTHKFWALSKRDSFLGRSKRQCRGPHIITDAVLAQERERRKSGGTEGGREKKILKFAVVKDAFQRGKSTLFLKYNRHTYSKTKPTSTTRVPYLLKQECTLQHF